MGSKSVILSQAQATASAEAAEDAGNSACVMAPLQAPPSNLRQGRPAVRKFELSRESEALSKTRRLSEEPRRPSYK